MCDHAIETNVNIFICILHQKRFYR